MKGFFSFARPKQRRFAMQFGYEARPSFWQNVRSNSHLVIAAAGTMALLGVAGTALWLAMPSGQRQAFANAVEMTETQTVETAAADSVVPVARQAAPKADEITPQTEAAEADIPALTANDPRWTDPNAPRRPAIASTEASAAVQAQAKVPADKQAVDPAANAQLAAFAAENAAAVHAGTAPDSSSTAAIPAVKPERQAPKKASVESAADPETTDATSAGHIVRAVTMRAGPKKGAAAIATVPAKTAVQVVSCEKWCQIVYNGKRGWIYKSFLKSGS